MEMASILVKLCFRWTLKPTPLKNTFCLLLLCLTCLGCQTTDSPVYQDSTKPVEDRVDDLLTRMTLEEKFWQLFMIPGDLSDGKERYEHGIFGFQVATKGRSGAGAEQMLDYSGGGPARETAERINVMQRYFVEETRLGIPIIPFDEALHGLIRPGATAFPQAIGLAASWDTSLVSEVATAIARETRSRGIRQILSPVVNIARDVRWGRTEETYGEDPYLTTQMGVAFMGAFERLGVITTPKHFVANVGDGGRDSYPIHFNERLLEEIYFPAYKAAFQKAGARSLMTAYNSVDGRQATANDWLLNQKVKEEWGFDGFVISDAGATGGANVLHFTAKNYAESTEQAIENGLDVIFQTSYDHYPLFYEAFEKGMIEEAAIDAAVRRVLRAKFQLGLFEDPYIDPAEAERWNGSEAHRELAREAARRSMVLLKNADQVLPLSTNNTRIALIGTDAEEARLGGYAGPGNDPVSMLEGIREQLGEGASVQYAPGPGREAQAFRTIPGEVFSHTAGDSTTSGLRGEYFNNIDLNGEPELVRTDARIDFGWTLFSPDPERINYDYYSVRWTGRLTAPETGLFRIGLSGDDGYRLYVDGELLIDNWRKQSVGQTTVPYLFRADQTYDIRVEFYETTGNVRLKLTWDQGVDDDWEKRIREAVRLSAKSDLAIVAAGIEEGEFQDRSTLALPGRQEELIQRITATGKPVVVLLVGGSAITMASWMDAVDAIVQVWYPGDMGGHAVADVLFGAYNPAGRLPVTFPMREGQLPLYYNHKPTGRGDDYRDGSGKPLFPFGFGLSYTSFAYNDLRIEPATITPGDTAFVRATITNTGDRAGEEVVQLYIKDLFASVARPVQELKGFQRIMLEPGASREVRFPLAPDHLQMLNEGMEWVVEPGEFLIRVGASSNDVRLRGMLRVGND